MARRIKDNNLDTREARRKLKPRGKPYWRAIGKGLHLGYRKNQGGGAWVVRHYLGNQNYRTETLEALPDDVEDANGTDVLSFWQAQEAARQSRPGTKRASAYTVNDAVRDYLEYLGDRPSAYDVKRRLAAYVTPALGARPVNDLEAGEIARWLRDMARMPARCRTKRGQPQAYRATDFDDPEAVRGRQVSANRIWFWLRAALVHAWRERKSTGVESRDEWSRVRAFKGVELPRTRYLSATECQHLIKACKGDFRTLACAALLTGARYGELARLRVADFKSGTLHVRQSKTYKDRHIILTDEGRGFFARLAVGPGDAPLLGRKWGKSQQCKPMSTACARAGIQLIGFHGLRHTWASLAVMAGASLFVVAKALGHKNTRMVEKHYGHLSKDYVHDELQAKAPRFGLGAM